ncbi:Metallocarboxypeptidase A-like protein [Cladobotryum mycophilum]|uniref:Metallocarboxypeptidase A-like protein n=1 Tax=Cladobotryum mycophilum TaxID=491253 RepID=A0ABR0STE3_9HYPO
MKSLAILSAFLATASAAAIQPPRVSYDGYKVFRVPVGEHVERVNDVASKLDLQTWKAAKKAGAFADFAVHPDKLDAFHKEVGDLKPIVMHEDLGASIAEESSLSVYAAGSANSTWFTAYHSYADHVQFLKDLQAQFPSNSKIVSSGTSLQGNDITGIHFYGKNGGGKNPAVVFHGTVHAREWIGTKVVEYFAYTLLNGYGSDTKITGYLDKFDFIFFPFVNPDGFIYTQTTDRMWRKNRQTTSGSSCLGHDINRNWPYKWDVKGGASTNPCAEDFKGAAAGDAPETKALAAFLQKTKAAQGVKIYIDYHSYSQLFMTPYGYSCSALPANNNEYQKLANGAVAAIKAVHGVSFQAGPICSTIYPATGSSVDYTADVVKADYVFTSELRDTGRYGFVLPANQIVPSGEEAFAGVKYLLENVK